PSAQLIRVFLESALAHRRTNLDGSIGADLAEVADDVPGTMSNQNFAFWRKELVHTSPGIGDQASTCARSFKDPGRRREANVSHRLPVDVQNHARRAIDAVMVTSAHMTDPTHVLRQWSCVP